MKNIVVIVEGRVVQGVHSDDGRSYVVVDGNAKDGGPYVYPFPGKTHEQIPPWAAHRLRLEGFGEREWDAFKSETLAWMQALEETVEGIRRESGAAYAQSKAQVSAFAEFGRWSERLHSLNKDIGDQEEAHVKLRDEVAENRQRITEVREVARAYVKSLERRVDKLEDDDETPRQSP